MNIIELPLKFLKLRQLLFLTFILANIASLVFAQSSINNIQKAMGTLCFTAQSLIVVVAIVLAVLSALIYAVGQILGAETRARATVWATAMFTGAIIGIIIYLVVPVLIAVLLAGNTDTNWVQECCRPEPSEACSNLGSGE